MTKLRITLLGLALMGTDGSYALSDSDKTGIREVILRRYEIAIDPQAGK